MKTLSEKYAFMYGELSVNAEVFSSVVIDYLESDDYTINKQFTYEDIFFYLIGHSIMNYQKKNNIN